jgi:hypothetical protein
MPNQSKGLDHLFAELRAAPLRPVSIDVALEDRVMKEFSNVQHARQRRRTLAAGLAAIAVVVGVAGAAGGYEVVKGWFGDVELVSPDGESATLKVQGNELLDENGNAVGQFTITGGDGEQSSKGQITVEPSTRDR